MAMNRRQRARQSATKHDASVRTGNASALRPEIRLEIGEVVLRGIDIRDRNGLAVALERELAGVLGEANVMGALQGGARDRVDGGVISLEASQSSPAMGGQIAHAVQRSLVGPLAGAAEAKIAKH
jgi:hypothetical protein